jgi:choline kinase|tara:strand:- start:247 stop:390 length:144 start_codon:yes stop_codon:yes gene_type:complete
MALNKVLERQAINLQSQGVTHIRIVAGFMQNLAVGVMRSGLSPLVKI